MKQTEQIEGDIKQTEQIGDMKQTEHIEGDMK